MFLYAVDFDWRNIMNKLIKAALSQYEAQRDEALAVLDVYLNNSVGIGIRIKSSIP